MTHSAAYRVLSGGNLAPRGCNRRKAKLALLLVIELNPRDRSVGSSLAGGR